MAEDRRYYLILSTNAVVQILRMLDMDGITEEGQYLVRDILTGEESPCWQSDFGEQLTEMEVLAYASKGSDG